jgi:hypothetical protein
LILFCSYLFVCTAHLFAPHIVYSKKGQKKLKLWKTSEKQLQNFVHELTFSKPMLIYNVYCIFCLKKNKLSFGDWKQCIAAHIKNFCGQKSIKVARFQPIFFFLNHQIHLSYYLDEVPPKFYFYFLQQANSIGPSKKNWNCRASPK